MKFPGKRSALWEKFVKLRCNTKLCSGSPRFEAYSESAFRFINQSESEFPFQIPRGLPRNISEMTEAPDRLCRKVKINLKRQFKLDALILRSCSPTFPKDVLVRLSRSGVVSAIAVMLLEQHNARA